MGRPSYRPPPGTKLGVGGAQILLDFFATVGPKVLRGVNRDGQPCLRTLQIAPISTAPAKGLTLWEEQTLAAPLLPDVQDDLMPEFACLATEFEDLSCEFDAYLPEEWTDKLVGASRDRVGARIDQSVRP